jgi:hypothetical protein
LLSIHFIFPYVLRLRFLEYFHIPLTADFITKGTASMNLTRPYLMFMILSVPVEK